MKILNMIAQKPYATGSGIYMTELIKAFDKLGHEQAVLYGRNLLGQYHQEEAALWQELRIGHHHRYPVEFNSQRLPFDIFGMSDAMPYRSLRYRDMTLAQSQAYEAEFIRVMGQAVAEFQPDLVLGHHLYLATALFAENFPDIKLWGICHGTDLRQLETNPKQRDRVLSSLQKLDKAFALQEEQAEEIQSLFGLSPESIKVVGNGFNGDIFHIKESRRTRDCCQRDWQKDPVRLVYAGKIAKSKGLLSLIRAVDQIEESLILDLVGGFGAPDEFEEIQSLAEASKHDIRFLGHLNQVELAECFNHSDLFVLPSYYEGLGLVCIEAAACGLPVVVSKTSGIEEFVADKIQQNHFVFIDLPAMEGKDQPLEAELPAFEKRLAEGIQAQIYGLKEGQFCQDYLDKDGLSWMAVALKILGNQDSESK